MNIDKLPPHEQRVVAEVNALDENRQKLLAFIQSPRFQTVPDIERALMVEQAVAMDKLSSILHQRLEIFVRRTEAAQCE
jgi:hypothetical protein